MDDHRPMQRMHRSRDVIGPKSKIPIRLKCNDGSELVGYVHVCGQERILDLVNDSRPFLPFETNEGKILLINKSMVGVIEPFDKERMTSSDSAPPTMQPAVGTMRKKKL